MLKENCYHIQTALIVGYSMIYIILDTSYFGIDSISVLSVMLDENRNFMDIAHLLRASYQLSLVVNCTNSASVFSRP